MEPVFESKPDTSKKYMCYFCEEEVEFSLPSKEFMKLLFDGGTSCRPIWRHCATQQVSCSSNATPSNLGFDLKRSLNG